jgi:hypothetical protein
MSGYTYYAIVIYIIIMITLVILKPDFIYDHNKKIYREFGTTEGKTLLSLPALSIGLAILLVIVFSVLKIGDKIIANNNVNTKTKYKYKYVPIPMMSAIPNMTNSTYDTETIRNLDS